MQTWIVKEIMSEKFKSISWIDRVPAGGLVFEKNIRFDLMSPDSRSILKNIITSFPNQEVQKSIPVCHATYKNGSEKDLWSFFAKHGEAVLLVEISYSWIDQHFIQFMLWETADGTEQKYPVDELFIDEFFKEERSDKEKLGEMFIKPTAIIIHSIKFDVSSLIPNENEIKKLEEIANNYPNYQFWTKFITKDYIGAGDSLKDLLGRSYMDKSTPEEEVYLSFVNSIYAICKYKAEEYESAGELFILIGKDYLRAGLKRNADICFFFALEAGKRMPDINKAFEIAREAVEGLRFISDNLKKEALGIIKSYYASVYMGTAVLCRRLIEIYITEKLEMIFKSPINKQIDSVKKNGEMTSGIGPGLFGILELAKLRGIINEREHNLASKIKDFGNEIHRKGGIENSIDAKYAIQSCIHFIHRA